MLRVTSTTPRTQSSAPTSVPRCKHCTAPAAWPTLYYALPTLRRARNRQRPQACHAVSIAPQQPPGQHCATCYQHCAAHAIVSAYKPATLQEQRNANHLANAVLRVTSTTLRAQPSAPTSLPRCKHCTAPAAWPALHYVLPAPRRARNRQRPQACRAVSTAPHQPPGQHCTTRCQHYAAHAIVSAHRRATLQALRHANRLASTVLRVTSTTPRTQSSAPAGAPRCKHCAAPTAWPALYYVLPALRRARNRQRPQACHAVSIAPRQPPGQHCTTC